MAFNSPGSIQRDRIPVAAISLTATADTEHNWRQAVQAVREAADSGAEWVQLPEMWTFMGDYGQLSAVAEEEGGRKLSALQELARSKKIVLFAGTLVEKPNISEQICDQEKYYNTLYVIDRAGEILGKYRKVHLFNLVQKEGKKSYCESDGYLAGSNLVCVEIDGFRVFLSICYDLRFGAFYTAALNKMGPFDVIVAPSAFTKFTGEAHWELLLRSRAVEFQCFVFAANQIGDHGNNKQSFGHSMLVDPWGRILSSTGSLASIAYGSIDRDIIKQVRHQLPLLSNRRGDLYR
jgi:predicted amidohydrolase